MRNKTLLLSLVGIAILAIAGLVFGFRNYIFADTQSSNGSKFAYFRTSLYGKELSQIHGVNLNLPKGETESFTLEIVNNNTRQSYNNLTIAADSLKNGSESFPRENIDLRLINSWVQKEISFDGNSTNLVNVNELLVRRNRENYLSPDISMDAKSLPNKLGITSSSVDRDESIKFSLSGKESAKIFLKFSAPPTAGIYTGSLRIAEATGGKDISTLPIKINVSEKTLPQPDKKFACYVNDRIQKDDRNIAPPKGAEEYYIGGELFRQRLADIRAMGCNALVLRVSKASDNAKMLEYATELGFNQGVLIDFRYINKDNIENKWNDLSKSSEATTESIAQQQFKDVVNEIIADSKISIPVKFYGVDEPNERIAPTSGNNSIVPRYVAYKTKALNMISLFKEVLGEKGIQSGPITPEVTSAMVNCTYDDLQKESDQLLHGGEPILNYTFDPAVNRIPGLTNCNQSMKDYISARKTTSSKPVDNATYYFQASREQPNINRYLGGLGLVFSGFHGYYLNVVYGYAEKDKNGNQNTPIFSENNLAGKDKNLMLMYPASDGLIPTVQSEAIREGIMDIKYYLAYLDIKNNLGKCSKKSLAGINSYLAAVEGYTKNNNILTLSSLRNNSYDLPNQNIETLRANLKNLFFKYNELCEAESRPSVVPNLSKTPGAVRTQDRR